MHEGTIKVYLKRITEKTKAGKRKGRKKNKERRLNKWVVTNDTGIWGRNGYLNHKLEQLRSILNFKIILHPVKLIQLFSF